MWKKEIGHILQCKNQLFKTNPTWHKVKKVFLLASQFHFGRSLPLQEWKWRKADGAADSVKRQLPRQRWTQGKGDRSNMPDTLTYTRVKNTRLLFLLPPLWVDAHCYAELEKALLSAGSPDHCRLLFTWVKTSSLTSWILEDHTRTSVHVFQPRKRLLTRFFLVKMR